ncbi:cyclase family protein [Microbacterium soli]|uniref:cyclase family protein n=1 Tax=Microbacterium soli TaxID=446075 RepID=UPI0031D9048E
MKKVVNISLALGSDYLHNTPEGVKNVQMSFEIIKDYPGGVGQQVRAVTMRLHHGTHVDAPMHFVPGGKAIDDFPLETFVGEAVLADLTPYVGENEAVQPEHLQAALKGRSITGKRLLMRTDWNAHYGEPDYLERAPYIGPAAVDWVVSQRPVLVGYDYAHSKDAPDTPREVYALKSFLENDILTMGYIRNLDQLPADGKLTLVAAPLAFEQVEASPIRAVVIVED